MGPSESTEILSVGFEPTLLRTSTLCLLPNWATRARKVSIRKLQHIPAPLQEFVPDIRCIELIDTPSSGNQKAFFGPNILSDFHSDLTLFPAKD